MHGGANRAVPAPVSVPTDVGVPFLNNASMSAWQVSGPGADQVANGWFTGRFSLAVGTTREASKFKPYVIPDPPRVFALCQYQTCALIAPMSGHISLLRSWWPAANNIPYSIALLDVQRRRVPALSPEKQPPQIRHLAADNRKQFREGTMPVEFCPP